MSRSGSPGVLKCMGTLLGGALVAILLVASPPATASTGTVKLEGHVWGASISSSGITPHRGSGATVRIAEHPELTTTAAADGSWSLEVPDRQLVTPCAEFEGHHPTCNQTYFTRGEDLNQINFQMVVDVIANALGALSGGEMYLTEEGSPRVKRCAIVSTFYEKEKRSYLDFQDFLEGAPHGVAGATAVATASDGTVIPGPIYFNEHVMPDKTFTASSRDGGVMWVEIPPGTYTITASHPTARFAPFQATCEEGRLINASPPWGLYEMARIELPNPAVLPPDPDRTLEGRVLSAKVARSGRTRTLKLRINAGERLQVRVQARQGKRQVSRRSTVSSGRRTISIRLNRNFKAGSLRSKTTLTDKAGNQVTSVARLHVPKIARRKK